jgi:hypothetical protein
MLCLATGQAHAQGAGRQWETLNQEVEELSRARQYARAVMVAKEALKLAEQHFGPNHPAVANIRTDLAELYRDIAQIKEVEKLAEKFRGLPPGVGPPYSLPISPK